MFFGVHRQSLDSSFPNSAKSYSLSFFKAELLEKASATFFPYLSWSWAAQRSTKCAHGRRAFGGYPFHVWGSGVWVPFRGETLRRSAVAALRPQLLANHVLISLRVPYWSGGPISRHSASLCLMVVWICGVDIISGCPCTLKNQGFPNQAKPLKGDLTPYRKNRACHKMEPRNGWCPL